MWVAVNQCLGSGAVLVNVAESLERRVQLSQQLPIPSFNTSSFTIAFNGSEARIFVTWMDVNKKDYFARKVASFLLTQPDQYRRFRSHVRNIIDWGMGDRLSGITRYLDHIVDTRPTAITNNDGTDNGLKKRARPRSRGSRASRSRGRSASDRGVHMSTLKNDE